MTSTKEKVAILGGGMAGLEAAVSIATNSDVEIDVIERGPDVRTSHVGWDDRVYPGDEKRKRWTSDSWGEGGGLSERLGGRSLCYHGVLLEIESGALASWPQSWQENLSGESGLYAEVRQDLVPDFPELQNAPLLDAAREIGLRHVPQAGFYDKKTGLFRAYSPLDEARRLRLESDDFKVIRGAAQRIIQQKDGRWSLEAVDPDGETYVRGDYIACILGASAIGNIQLLAPTLERSLQTTITDHFSVGALARLRGGEPVGTFRHGKLWSGGYLSLPELRANVFVQEMAPSSSGERMVDVNAIIEQGEGLKDYSLLAVSAEPSLSARIEAKISPRDQERIKQVGDKVLEIVNKIAGDEPPRTVITSDSSYESSLEVVIRKSGKSVVSPYSFPYGSFEHESSTHPIGGEPLPVTPELEVEELPGVFVAGPGSFPRMGAANPALTILAMSRVIARTVRGRYL